MLRLDNIYSSTISSEAYYRQAENLLNIPKNSAILVDGSAFSVLQIECLTAMARLKSIEAMSEDPILSAAIVDCAIKHGVPRDELAISSHHHYKQSIESLTLQHNIPNYQAFIQNLNCYGYDTLPYAETLTISGNTSNDIAE